MDSVDEEKTEAGGADTDTEDDESDCKYSDDDSDGELDADDLADLFKNPERIIEGLCFLGDVIQDTSDKICDVLDESLERVMEHDFDD